MSSEQKYIVVNYEGGKECIFIFPKVVNHSDMFDVMVCLSVNDKNHNPIRVCFKLISAGFTDGEHCYGRSESLNCDSRSALDSKLLPGNQ